MKFRLKSLVDQMKEGIYDHSPQRPKVALLVEVELSVGKIHRRRQSSEVRGGNVNLCQPTPCQKLKTHRIWSTIFWEGPQIHIKKM